jgi:hypothetical protein
MVRERVNFHKYELNPMPNWVKIALTLIALATVIIVLLKETGFGFSTYSGERFASLHASRDRNNTSKFYFSGHIMGSWNCLGPVTVQRSGNELNVSMSEPLLCGSQGGGNFNYALEGEGPFTSITYGEDRRILYRE